VVKGAYVLIIELREDRDVRVGALGVLKFKRGWYAYVGSALNNLEARIERHLRKRKRKHWHIDYFLEVCRVRKIVYTLTEKRVECLIAKGLSERFDCVERFGCSDCNCRSHLFFSKCLRDLFEGIVKVFEELG